MKEFFSGKVMLMGFLHMLVAFSAITVITQVVGFNLPLAFVFAGVSTILFHIITKNKLPVTLGVSGIYIGSILAVSQTYGVAYAHGGIIVAGFVYLLFALLMFKWQNKILKLFPMWMLSTVVLLIGLTLLPIGTSMIQSNLLIGLVAFTTTALVDLLGGKKIGAFAMPLGILTGTIVALLTGDVDFGATNVTFEYVAPLFNWQSALMIGLVAIPVLFEMMGDTRNIGQIIGKDVFKEVGLGRISLGNGLGSILGGLGGSNAYTTYSENAGFLMLSRYYNPTAQIWTGIFMITMAFITPVFQLISAIPMEAFGGVTTYLFAMIAVNAIRQIVNSVDINKDGKAFSIMVAMLAISMMPIVISGISVSSVAIATAVGVLLNWLFNK